ncbi:MAG: helical backbone metal receptor [Acidimicrobiales bacterium]
MRIVSLVPSVTETLAAWDRTPIACTRFCERPDLEQVGGTKDPDIERIVELSPDLVVVDAEENRREDYEALVSCGVEAFALHVRSLTDVDDAMTDLANRVGARWTSIDAGEPRTVRARAFIPIWRRPYIALGTPTYGSSLLAQLGVANIFETGDTYPEVDLANVASIGADMVLAPSEPYPFTTRQLLELETVAPTVFVDGKDLFWWGSRTRAALDRLDRTLSVLTYGCVRPDES